MNTIEIHRTNNYDLFKPHGEQRPVDRSHVRKLAASMVENGFISAHPIHVYREGKTYRIIDGHHRHEAARHTGVDLFYTITGKSEAGLIAVTNQCVKRWAMPDFIRMYAQRGFIDYITLSNYIEAGIPHVLAISLLVGQSGGSRGNSSVANGSFKIKNTACIDELVRICGLIGAINSEARSRVFMDALAVLLKLECFSASLLISRIEANPRMLTKCATRQQMLEQLEEIYNFRAREKINLAFIAAEYLKARNVAEKGAA